MNWRDMVGSKLMTPAEAVSAVKSGDQVMVGIINCTPYTLCQALYDRRSELEGIQVDHPAAFFSWVRDGDEDVFDVHELYATPFNRDVVNEGRVAYHPTAVWRDGDLPPGFLQNPDVFLVPVSPPDANGYCSFGPGVFFSRTWSRNSKIVIAEVHENFIRTGGENYVHVSQIDRMCEAEQPTGTMPVAPRTEEENLVTEVVGTLVATELVNDRDTVQIGIGTIASAMAAFLGDKQDLGMQTEIITGGVTQLVEEGVVTGKYKTLHQGKVVASIALVPEEELAFIDGNPVFELYQFGYVDDVRYLAQQNNLVAINNALQIDMTGQITAETLNGQVYSGPGGQTVFAVAASYSEGGRSIIAVPSSSTVDGERHSRIVPVLPPGTMVTVPRTFVDYVVTEYGIATLRGKTVRQRVEELIAVAHPDFRAELRAQAAKLYHV